MITRRNNQSDDWRGLGASEQRPRYVAISNFIHRADITTILDVGCGEALLYDWVPPNIRYTGIEPSASAALLAEAKCPGRIIRSTAEAFNAPGMYWERIVFSEVLYYSVDPLGLLRKYARLLTPDGTIIISIYMKPGWISFKKRFRHLMDRRRPKSNLHCIEMVMQFLTDEKWTVLTDQQVCDSAFGNRWRILSVRPPRS